MRKKYLVSSILAGSLFITPLALADSNFDVKVAVEKVDSHAIIVLEVLETEKNDFYMLEVDGKQISSFTGVNQEVVNAGRRLPAWAFSEGRNNKDSAYKILSEDKIHDITIDVSDDKKSLRGFNILEKGSAEGKDSIKIKITKGKLKDTVKLTTDEYGKVTSELSVEEIKNSFVTETKEVEVKFNQPLEEVEGFVEKK